MRACGRALRVLGVVMFFLWMPRAATAQRARDARVSVTVADATGAVLPDAVVTIAGLERATQAVAAAPVRASAEGVATFSGLPPGRYSIHAEFPGFEPTTLGDVRLRAGENRQTLVLPLQKVETTVNVGQDPETAASDRRGSSFGSALTREQIDALADDPNEMRRQLQDMAGPGAVIRVDSFEGSELPPKAMIKSIRVTRDAFAAENHNAGAFFLDIITQPGLGTFRGGINTRFRTGALSGRSPFTPTKGPEQLQDYGINLGGPLIAGKSTFNIFINGVTSYDTPNLNVALPGAGRSEALSQRTLRDRVMIATNFDYAITRDQTLRVSYNPMVMKNSNLGIGAYDLPGRAYSTEDRSHNLRIQEAGPLGRRFFINTRLGLTFLRSTNRSDLEAPTIVVNDAFTSGGQQLAGGRRQSGGNLSSDLDYVRGVHSVRTGLSLDFHSYHSDNTSNYLGTYTFASLPDYEAGRPTSYTRRVGDPTVEYRNVQAALYAQDDIRVRRSLTLSPGVRYEVQSHLGDVGNVGPRFGITWAPFKGGKTTLRASVGVFYDWLNTNTYEQTLRIDGFHQQELYLLSPPFPVLGNDGVIPPANRYLLDDELHMASNVRVSAGVDQMVAPRLRVGVLYANTRGTGLLRGLNLNAPVDGVPPDPRFGNIIEVVSDARSQQHAVTLTMNAGVPPPPPFGGTKGPRWDWKRATVNGSYTWGSFRNNTDGDFSTSPSGVLNDDWGPAGMDIRHRLFIGAITQTLRDLNVVFSANVASAPPYTIRTGRDDNRDAIFNDRPAGVGRNTGRGAAQVTLNVNVAYAMAFGKGPPPTGIGGIFVQNGPGGGPATVTTFQPPPARFRLLFFANAQNLLNRANYGGYSGTLTSPFFGQPTLVTNPRKTDFGISFQF